MDRSKGYPAMENLAQLKNSKYPWSPLEKKEACCEPATYFEITNLSLSYNKQFAFENISMNINKGCITALVGPSGSGKTSFLSCLNRMTDLIPTAQIKGELKFESECILSKKINTQNLRRRIGMIFQKPNPFSLSIRKNLTLPLSESGIKDRQKQNVIVEKVLNEVGLWNEVKDRLDSSALLLSGGQQQRLCIARSLTLNPEVLLMDEPCSALDPISSGVVEDLITRLRGKYTVLIVTHNLAQARRIADFVGVFWVQNGAGQLIEYGSKQQIFENPKNTLTSAYISGIRG